MPILACVLNSSSLSCPHIATPNLNELSAVICRQQFFRMSRQRDPKSFVRIERHFQSHSRRLLRTVARIFPTKVCRKRQALVGNDKHLEVAGTHRLSRTSKSYCYRQGDNEPGYGRMIAVLSTNNKYCTGNIYDLTDRRIAHEAHSEFGATTTCGNPGPKRVRAAIRKMTFFRKPRYT
jgi:hypothetical protein